MSSRKGYFSLIQLCPNKARLEAINVGVVLIREGEEHPVVRMGKHFTRVREVFGDLGLNNHLLRRAQEKARNELLKLASTCEAVAAYSERQSGLIQLSSLRPIVVENTAEAVDSLFAELVSDPAPRTRKKNRKLRLKVDPLRVQGVTSFRTEVSIPLPPFMEPVEADFSWDNGVRNYVTAVDIDDKNAGKITKDRGAIGQLLSTERSADNLEQKLILVARCENDSLLKETSSVLEKCHTRVVAYTKLDEYLDEVRQFGH